MQWDDAIWNNLLTLIAHKKVVPIIGRALSCVQNEAQQAVPLHKLLEQRLAQALRIDTTTLPSGGSLSELYLACLQPQTRCSIELFHDTVQQILWDCTPRLEALLKLAGITDFSLFVTTAIDGFLVKALQQARGTSAIVQDLPFAPNAPCDLPAEFKTESDIAVYQLFGGHATCPHWAVSVEHALDFVFALHNEKSRPYHFFDFLKSRHVLAIGCQIPDWLGRSFFHCLRGGPLY